MTISSLLKPRDFDFTVSTRRGPTRTRREILDSLKLFARERNVISFTQKQYNTWGRRLLCSAQIAERFGKWEHAMDQAGLEPAWRAGANLTEMVELFKDCWVEHRDAPTERVLSAYLKKQASRYTVNMYRRRFGGVCRLTEMVAAHARGAISDAQLLEPYQRSRTPRKPIPAKLRAAVLQRDGYHCVKCGQGKPLDVHHKVLVSTGGTDEMDNLETLNHAMLEYMPSNLFQHFRPFTTTISSSGTSSDGQPVRAPENERVLATPYGRLGVGAGYDRG